MPQNLEIPGNLGWIAVIGLIITIFFCMTLYNTLGLVKSENQKIKPFTVWLLFIPGFNMVWNFFVVLGVAYSLRDELISRDYDVREKPALISGLGYSVISCLSLIPYFVEIPKNWLWALGAIGVLEIIFFVQYWTKISWYKTILREDNADKEP